jgi:hypothetical protein
MVVHVCNPSTQEVEAGGSMPAWDNSETKMKTTKTTWECV